MVTVIVETHWIKELGRSKNDSCQHVSLITQQALLVGHVSVLKIGMAGSPTESIQTKLLLTFVSCWVLTPTNPCIRTRRTPIFRPGCIWSFFILLVNLLTETVDSLLWQLQLKG